jgi:hypothetical protein
MDLMLATRSYNKETMLFKKTWKPEVTFRNFFFSLWFLSFDEVMGSFSIVSLGVLSLAASESLNVIKLRAFFLSALP